MKRRWVVEYAHIREFDTACRERNQNPLWKRMTGEFQLVMGGTDFTSNFV
jgi:hypothetical protein